MIFPNADKLEMINPDRHDIGDDYYNSAYQQMVSELNLKPEHHNSLLTDMALHKHETAHDGKLDIKVPAMLIHGQMPDFRDFGIVNSADYGKLNVKEVKYTVAIPEGDKITAFSGKLVKSWITYY